MLDVLNSLKIQPQAEPKAQGKRLPKLSVKKEKGYVGQDFFMPLLSNNIPIF